MRMIRHYLSRNILSWKEGTHTLQVTFRGSKEELMKKLKEELEQDLANRSKSNA